jgi:anti-sigma factor RsiW
MATLSQIDSLLQAYIDGELGEAERIILEKELASDSRLRKQLQERQAISALMFESLEPARLKENLTARIMGHLPIMDARIDDSRQRMVQEVNWRAKHRRGRAQFFFTLLPALAPVLLLILGFALFTAWPETEDTSSQTVGMVTFENGDVRASTSDMLVSRRVELRAAVRENQHYALGEDSTLMLSLAGPSSVKVDENTDLDVINARNLKVTNGRIWLNIAKDKSKFRVLTPAGDITVFGTKFGVEVTPHETVVTLQEGSVHVENNVTFAVLEPDTMIRMRRDQTSLKPERVDAKERLAWAFSIQPDSAAEDEFFATVKPLGSTIIRAEQMWRLDTRNHEVPSSITFTWKPDLFTVGHSSYDVYVYDESMNPLFVGHIPGELFGKPERNSYQMKIPETNDINNMTVFIRIVANDRNGSIETTFTEVSVMGV